MTIAETLKLKLLKVLGERIVGYRWELELFLVSLLSRGHALVEGLPGTGKTLVAKLFAQSLGLDFKRIQMAPDMLPGDIIGAKIVDPKTGELRLVLGPIHTNIVLVDELNRASPKTQSALLEAMQEGYVNIEGEEIKLPEPFMVIATLNPYEREGIFPLPIASLDRFTLSLEFNYLDREGEVEVLRRDHKSGGVEPVVKPVATANEVLRAIEEVSHVYVDDKIMNYIVDVVRATRGVEGVVLGASTRAAVHLLRACKAYAAMNGRDYVLPDDVKKLAVPVLSHRIVVEEQSSFTMRRRIIESVLSKIPPPW